jgi:hypothetical protein
VIGTSAEKHAKEHGKCRGHSSFACPLLHYVRIARTGNLNKHPLETELREGEKTNGSTIYCCIASPEIERGPYCLVTLRAGKIGIAFFLSFILIFSIFV